MKDCHADITKFHKNDVKIKLTQKKNLKSRRDANQKRVKNGLTKNNDPLPKEFVRQGSDAHRTTIQEPNNEFDIDDGIVFLKDDLKGAKGADKTALNAKKMVRDAVDDGSFKTEPEVKTNCVRIHYDDGSHVDMPVYRKTFDDLGNEIYEIASSEWKKSDPKGVRTWFDDCCEQRCEEGREQMRDLIRLNKWYCKHRSYSLPSGFVWSVLTDEKYMGFDERLDRAFRNLILAIRDRLEISLEVEHPVVDELLAENDDPKCRKLKELLTNSIEDLNVLDQANCKRSTALKAWKKVFAGTHYFDGDIESAEAEEKRTVAAAIASASVIPKPYGENGS